MKLLLHVIFFKFDKSNSFISIFRNLLNSIIFTVKINTLFKHNKSSNNFNSKNNLIKFYFFMVRNSAIVEFRKEIFFSLATSDKIVIYGDSRVIYNRDTWYESRPIYSPLLYKYNDYVGDVIVSNFRIRDFNQFSIIFLDKNINKLKLNFSLGKRKSYSIDNFGIPVLMDAKFSYNFKNNYKKNTAKNKLTIIIPTNFKLDDTYGIHSSIKSLIQVQGNLEFEFNIVFHISDKTKFDNFKEQFKDLKINAIQYSKEFNFSEAINLGMQESKTSLNLLLNDDVNLIESSNLEHLVNHLGIGKIGAIGIRLINQQQVLSHAGLEYRGNRPNHFLNGSQLKFMEKSHQYCREVSGVTGAFILISKENFNLAGKMNLNFPNDYNDVDLMINLQKLGFSNLICSKVIGYHAESFTRGRTKSEEIEMDFNLLTSLHGTLPNRDPYLYTPATRLTKNEIKLITESIRT